MVTVRRRILQVIVVSSFITGAVLLGVGSAGSATPLVVAGILLLIAGGAGGFMTSVDRYATPISRSNGGAASSAETEVYHHH